MDLITIVGLLGTLVTFEEAGRGWLPFIKVKRAKRKIQLTEWNSNDPIVQRALDEFKCKVKEKYEEHLFSPEEIEEIVDLYFKENKILCLGKLEKDKIKEYIRDILCKYNEYNRSLMSPGEKIIHNDMQNKCQKIATKLDQLTSKEENDNINKFKTAIEMSKNIGLDNIEDSINGEYIIDRSSFIEEIKKDDCRFISIQGNAGCGKSVLCKNIVKNETYVLFARAERFIKENNINDIWNCNLEEALNWLSGEKIVIFIDALEFIADCTAEKIELLQGLYNVAGKYKNVYIITSCRTTDKNAFIKLQTRYEIKTYDIDDISVEELKDIAKKYPIIQEMINQKSYADLLKSPFYINLVLSNHINTEDISDENTLRQIIWNNIICLKNKARQYGVTSDAIMEAVNLIVFKRAKDFLVGIHKDEIDQDILSALISEGVVVPNGEYIRLKYDIFEDISFEHYFDKQFEDCRGNYQKFYEKINSLGRCVYRRYQIWISNKLFLQKTRDKFIYALIFERELPIEWKKQTEIGIVKSKYCDVFFEGYSEELISNNQLEMFIQITNLYAFEAKLLLNSIGAINMVLKPIGRARESLIILLEKNNSYISNSVNRGDIIKLCSDYSKVSHRDKNVTVAACRMMECYLEEVMNKKESGWYYSAKEEIAPFLEIIYPMAEASVEWLKEFFNKVVEYHEEGNHEGYRWSNDIIEWTVQNAYPVLVNNLANELCILANTLWLKGEVQRRNNPFYIDNDLKEYELYGLSESADEYKSLQRDISSNIFLYNLFRCNFIVGLKWAIGFVNEVMSTYAKNEPQCVEEVEVYFIGKKQSKKYLGNPNMWLAGIEENNVPLLVGDIIYLLKDAIINSIEVYKNEQELIQRYTDYVKNELYTKSNNIALLSIIEGIGLHFQKELPGYALDLATSFEILYVDIERYELYIPNPTKELLQKQILQIMGVPELEKRYLLDKKCNFSLQKYVAKTHLDFGENIKVKCNEVCDYLYSLTNNDSENALDYLQVQKMDMRNVTIKHVEDNLYAIEPVVTGEAERIVQKNKENKEEASIIQELNDLFAKCVKDSSGKIIDYTYINKVIDDILRMIAKDEIHRIQLENNLIYLIAIVLSDKSLKKERRDSLCIVWIEGIERYFSNGSFLADVKLTPILIEQLKSNISDEVRNRLKILMLECLLHGGHHGLINQIADMVKKYLNADKELAKAYFNTIIKLAEDEMNHIKYNAAYLQTSNKVEKFEFKPNLKHIWLNEKYIKEEGGSIYDSKRDEIIDTYLFSAKELSIGIFNTDDYDIGTLCYISNCGLGFDNPQFSLVMRKIVLCMIDIWNYHKITYNADKIINIFQEREVVSLYQREIVLADGNTEKVVDSLFDDMDFSKFTHDTIEFYQDIFQLFLCTYFDGYSDQNKRTNIEKKIKYISMKVDKIEVEYVRKELYKSLTFSIDRFYQSDWSKLKTQYSYRDKKFLNGQFSKYGKYHIKELLYTIYQLHMEELLPEILLSVDVSFYEAIKDGKNFGEIISEAKWIVDVLILKAFTYYGDKIKKDEELTSAFERILESLIEVNNEKAAVILDEFRIH
ncbi:hypothetical protein [Cellulosilyticum sp. WCF-2]|uniref:hypothetical protein n=1 Tax=Cellulosilyticum sp. WCF-2 TaxID=2497860 RepID=UPI000F8F627C|nr:hypothetical protein [Cellulosilyticum sp. WCF-2]QEH67830.1 hypothetical protein EKH84_05200 [Cellulosilyticum sp. WCF-2]